MHKIYDMINCLEANPGPMLSKHNCDLETRSLQDAYTENGRGRMYRVYCVCS